MFYQKCDLNRNSFNCGAKFEEENCAKWENIRMAVLHHHSYSLAFVNTNYLCGCCTQDPLCILQDLSLQRMDSLVIVHRLSCSVAFGSLIPWPGIEPVSPALQGGFLTAGPPGKSLSFSVDGPLFYFSRCEIFLYTTPPDDDDFRCVWYEFLPHLYPWGIPAWSYLPLTLPSHLS